MSAKTRQWAKGAGALTALALLLAFIVAPEIAPAREPNPNAWLASLSTGQLADASAKFASLPTWQKKAVAKTLTPEQRSGYIRSFISEFVQTHPSLKAETVATLREVQQMISPDYYAHSSKYTLQNQDLVIKLRATMNKADFDQVFNIGVATAKPSMVSTALGWMRTQLVVQAESLQCGCSQEQAQSPCTNNDCRAACSCTVTAEACYIGWGVWGDCYGLCGPMCME